MSNRVSESEKRVMEVLWQTSPLSSKEVVERLSGEDWNKKTVKTFLNRLLKKGAIQYQQSGRQYLYSPSVAQEDFLREESAGFLDKIFGGDMKKLLATFVQSNQLSEEELSYLRTLLDEEGNNKRRHK